MFGDDLIGRHKSEIDTPSLLLDMDVMESNIARMAAFFADKPCKLRPHMKTHKLPLIARKQIESGAIGITCAKLDEVEIFLKEGIQNILLANQVVGPLKIARMVRLSSLGNLIICVDQYENARDISQAGARAGQTIQVLVEVNVGIDRCGVLPGQPALDLVRRISGLKNLRFCGLMGYEGGCFTQDPEEKRGVCTECNQLLVQTAELIARDGFPVEIVSAGGTNTYYLTGLVPGITDVQVGSYVTMDEHNRAFGVPFKQAITVLTTVISRPERGRAVSNAGKKSLSTDEGLPVCTTPGIDVFCLNEEHGHIRFENPDHPLKVGDKIEIVPSHGCTTIPLYDEYILLRNDIVVGIAPILARGAMR